MLIKILISLGITALISGLLALMFMNHWILVFALSFIVQLLAFYIGNTIYENILIEKAEQIRTQQLIEASKQIATVECPCGERNKQDVQVRFDQEVTYDCSQCGKKIKLDVDIKPILTTQPIYVQK